MIIKVSFLAAATIAAYAAVSHKNSSSIKPLEKDDLNLEQQQNNEGEMEDIEGLTEIEVLHNLVKELQQKKVRLESKLFESCGLKEEQSYIAHLQRHLEDKSAEIDMLNATILSLQAERKVLYEDVKQCVFAKKQLETTKKTYDSRIAQEDGMLQ